MIGVLMTLLSFCCTGRHTDDRTGSRPHHSPILTFVQTIDYSDTASLHKGNVMGAHMKDMAIKMKGSHPTAIAEGLEIFFNGLKDDHRSLRSATRYAELYLYNPNSPFRDEPSYLLYLEYLLKSPGIPEDLAERTKEKLRKASLNREGTVANDLHYIDSHGNEGSLLQLKADHTILIFYDPECPHCLPILRKIAANPDVNEGIRSGSVKVLAVYAEGKRDVWEKTKKDMPKQWTVAYDLTGILDMELYDLPAMPIVYYLGPDKRVVRKDVPL